VSASGAAKPFDARLSTIDLYDTKKEAVKIGDEAMAAALTLDLSWPVQRGRVVNWVSRRIVIVKTTPAALCLDRRCHLLCP
jgi:hypothetical protein